MTCSYRSHWFATFEAVSWCHTAKIRPVWMTGLLPMAFWMQTTGAVLLVIEPCSLARVQTTA